MGIQIEDGKGSGILATVNGENLLRTITEAGTTSGHISNDEGRTFTVFGTATAASGSVVALFIQNNDPSLLFVLDRVLVEGVNISGGTAIPNDGSFFSLGFNRTLSSGGGTTLTPIVLNRTSVQIPSITVVGNNPNMTGTFLESHRWYIQANGVAFEIIRPETDDIILGRTNTMEIRYTGTNSGTVFALAKFIMAEKDELP